MTPHQKDEMWKYALVAVLSAIFGGGAGLGSVAATGGVAGVVTVQVEGPIKAELPPDQAQLLQSQAQLTPAIQRLESTMSLFFAQYREDQAETRKVNDALRAAIFDLTQRVGIVERDAQSAGGAVKEHENRLRTIERNIQRSVP